VTSHVPGQRAKRKGAVAFLALVCVAVGLALVEAQSVRAGSILLTTEWLEKNGSIIEAGHTSAGIAELEQATRSLEGGDFETCLKQLEQAVRAHSELPPAHALLRRRGSSFAATMPASGSIGWR
jgi:hypothetical protein